MAWMEIDGNLTKLANFFKFFSCVLEKSLESDCGLFFFGESFRIFPFGGALGAFCVRAKVLGQIFSRVLMIKNN